jgi:hypothetical protein
MIYVGENTSYSLYEKVLSYVYGVHHILCFFDKYDHLAKLITHLISSRNYFEIYGH